MHAQARAARANLHHSVLWRLALLLYGLCDLDNERFLERLHLDLHGIHVLFEEQYLVVQLVVDLLRVVSCVEVLRVRQQRPEDGLDLVRCVVVLLGLLELLVFFLEKCVFVHLLHEDDVRGLVVARVFGLDLLDCDLLELLAVVERRGHYSVTMLIRLRQMQQEYLEVMVELFNLLCRCLYFLFGRKRCLSRSGLAILNGALRRWLIIFLIELQEFILHLYGLLEQLHRGIDILLRLHSLIVQVIYLLVVQLHQVLDGVRLAELVVLLRLLLLELPVDFSKSLNFFVFYLSFLLDFRLAPFQIEEVILLHVVFLAINEELLQLLIRQVELHLDRQFLRLHRLLLLLLLRLLLRLYLSLHEGGLPAILGILVCLVHRTIQHCLRSRHGAEFGPFGHRGHVAPAEWLHLLCLMLLLEEHLLLSILGLRRDLLLNVTTS